MSRTGAASGSGLGHVKCRPVLLAAGVLADGDGEADIHLGQTDQGIIEAVGPHRACSPSMATRPTVSRSGGVGPALAKPRPSPVPAAMASSGYSPAGHHGDAPPPWPVRTRNGGVDGQRPTSPGTSGRSLPATLDPTAGVAPPEARKVRWSGGRRPAPTLPGSAQYEVAWKSLPQYDDSVKRLLDAAIAGPDWKDPAIVPMPHPGCVDGAASLDPQCAAIYEVYDRGGGAASLDELMEEVDAFRSDILAFMEDYDLLLSPTMPTPAQPHDVIRTDRLPYGSYTRPHNLTGWPTAVVRGGTSPEGLPIGVQIAALPWREDVALAAAQLVESASGGWSPPSI